MLGGCESCLLMLWQGRKLLVLCTTSCKAVAVLREWMWELSVDAVTGQEAVGTVYDQLQGCATWDADAECLYKARSRVQHLSSRAPAYLSGPPGSVHTTWDGPSTTLGRLR